MVGLHLEVNPPLEAETEVTTIKMKKMTAETMIAMVVQPVELCELDCS